MFRLLISLLIVFSVFTPVSGQIMPADADFDGSGVVDIPDFLQFVNAFGLQAGQSGYDVKYDFDKNDVVDIPDFLLFVDVFGRSVETPPEPPIAGSIAEDRAALITLYQAAGGLNWEKDTNWFSNKPLGQWHGVTTDAQGRVVSLNLHNNRLSGVLPPELGKLSNLEYLSLYSNQLSGPIPSELGNLSNLQNLELYSNQLSGPIPPELGNLSNLRKLVLNANRLSGAIPVELSNLSNLVRVYLDNNPNLCMPSALVIWKFYHIDGVEKCAE